MNKSLLRHGSVKLQNSAYPPSFGVTYGISLYPHNGNGLLLKNPVTGEWDIHEIPITGVHADVRSAYLNGVAGQSLPSRVYYAYATLLDGQIVLDFKDSSSHGLDPETGVEVSHAGPYVLATRTFLGLIYVRPDGTVLPEAQIQTCLCWFNPMALTLQSPEITGNSVGASMAEPSIPVRITFLTLGGRQHIGGAMFADVTLAGNSVGKNSYVAVGLDGEVPVLGQAARLTHIADGGVPVTAKFVGPVEIAEGVHTLKLYLAADAPSTTTLINGRMYVQTFF